MVGMATGLAEAGFLPFVYSIATFASMRPYEFIRNGPILHQLPVRIVGVGGGFEYGPAGATHHALEDIGVMRIQPGITVIAPADYQQARNALLQTWNLSGPIYYRLGKDDRTTLPGLDGQFELGRSQVIRDGSDLLIITMGSVSSEAVAAAESLHSEGVDCTVMVVASINPPPIHDLTEYLSRFPLTMVIEAHASVGGLGSLVAEVVADGGLGCRVRRCAVSGGLGTVAGSQRYLEESSGLSGSALTRTALQMLKVAP
jgi:transketolase